MVSLRIGMSWRRIGALTLLAVLSLVPITDAGAQGKEAPDTEQVVARLTKAASHLAPGDPNVTRPLTATVNMLHAQARKPGASNWVKYALSTVQDGRTDIAFRQIYEAYVAENPSPDRFPISRGQAALHLGALALLEDRGKARGYFDQARQINPKLGEAWVQSARLTGLLEHPAAGLAIAQQGLNALGEDGAPGHLARLNMLMAAGQVLTLPTDGGPEAGEAKSTLEFALKLARSIPDKHLTAQILYRLAEWELRAGNQKKAIELATRGTDLSYQPEARRSLADGLSLQGHLYVLAGTQAKGMELLEKANIVHRVAGHRAAYARGQQRIAHAEERAGQQKKARHALNLALNTYEALGHTVGQAETLAALGNLEMKAGNTVRACEHWRTARRQYHRARLARQVKLLADDFGTAGCMLGADGGLIGSLAEARTKGAYMYQLSLAEEIEKEEVANIIREADYIAGQALSMLNRGSVLQAAGQAQQALDLNPQSKTGWFSFGAALVKLDMPVDALSAFQNAIDVPLDLISKVTRSSIALEHGAVLQKLGRWNEAYKVMQRGLQNHRPSGYIANTKLASSQAEIADRLGRPDEAASWLKRAIEGNEAGHRSGQNGFLYYRLGWNRRERRDDAQAVAAFSQAASLINAPEDRSWRAAAHFYVGDHSWALDRTDAACTAWLAAARDYRTANRESAAKVADRRRAARNCPPPAPARATTPAADKG